MMLVQNVLRAIRLELDQERRTYPGVSVEIVFFKYLIRTGIRQKRNNLYIVDSMGIYVPVCSHMIGGFS